MRTVHEYKDKMPHIVKRQHYKLIKLPHVMKISLHKILCSPYVIQDHYITQILRFTYLYLIGNVMFYFDLPHCSASTSRSIYINTLNNGHGIATFAFQIISKIINE
jgi:hypothetical protein